MISTNSRSASTTADRSRGRLFYRLAQQAVAIEPTTYREMVDSAINRINLNHNLLGYLSQKTAIY
jgi:hypothetical protein